MAERARIARYFAPLTVGESGSFGLTDDAAMLAPPAGQQLIITTDSVIETIHVRAGATPLQFAQKLMRRNLSDLAAMGAAPWRYTLNLHTPHGLDDAWFAAFATALATEQTHFGCVLTGGDSTSGAQHIHATMTCIGLIAQAPLRRTGARVGDGVYVSGTVGDAALALRLGHCEGPLAARYDAPTPRLALGQALCGIASSAMDISDGLLADAQQLAEASNVGMEMECARLPLSEAAATYRDIPDFWSSICGGDDYELLFTAPESHHESLMQLAARTTTPITRIGSVVAAPSIGAYALLLDGRGEPMSIRSGWEHA